MIASYLLLLISITSCGGFVPVARFVDRSNAVLFASDTEPPQEPFNWFQKLIGLDILSRETRKEYRELNGKIDNLATEQKSIVREQKSIVREQRGVKSILGFVVEDQFVSRYDLKRMMVTSANDVALLIQQPGLLADFSIIYELLSNEALASFVNHVVGGGKNSGFLTFPQGETTASKSQVVALQSVLKEIYSVYFEELQHRLEKIGQTMKIGDDAPSVNDIPNQSSSGSIVQEVTSYHLVAGYKILAELTTIFDESGIPTLGAALSPDVTVPPFSMDTSSGTPFLRWAEEVMALAVTHDAGKDYTSIDFGGFIKKIAKSEDLFVPLILTHHDHIFSDGLLTSWEQTELDIDGYRPVSARSNRLEIFELKSSFQRKDAKKQLKTRAYFLDLVASHLYKREKDLEIPLELKAAFYDVGREQQRTMNRRPISLNELKPLSVFKATYQDCTRI